MSRRLVLAFALILLPCLGLKCPLSKEEKTTESAPPTETAAAPPFTTPTCAGTAQISQVAGATLTTPSSLHPIAQSFQVASETVLSSLSLAYQKSASGPANLSVYVAIYDGNANVPNTAASPQLSLTKAITVAAGVTSFQQFAFPNQITLSPGRTYWIYALPNNPVLQAYTGANVYGSGFALYWDGGVASQWSNNPGGGDPLMSDINFIVNGCTN